MRKLGERVWWHLDSPLAVGTALSTLLFAIGLGGLVLAIVRSRRAWTGLRVRLTILLNVFTIVSATLFAEAALRILASPTSRGVSVLGRELLPCSWDRVCARNRALIDGAVEKGRWGGTFMVHDAELSSVCQGGVVQG